MKKFVRFSSVLILIIAIAGSFQVAPVSAASFTVDTITDASGH